MTTPDLTEVMHTLAQSPETVRKTRDICSGAARSLTQTRQMLSQQELGHTETRLVLNESRRESE